MPQPPSVVGLPVRAASAARAALALCPPGEVLVHRQSFAHTHLYAGSSGLVALTDRTASHSVCGVRVDPQTFAELADVRYLLAGDRVLVADRFTIELRRIWRTRVPRLRLPSRATLEDLRDRLADAALGLPLGTELRPAALVGLGGGLTPSGDDILCGALGAAHAWSTQARIDELWSEAIGRIATTTDLSGQFLHAAWRGQVAGELRALLMALPTHRWHPAYDELLRVGHTSGADLAHGVFLMLSTLHDDEENRIDD